MKIKVYVCDDGHTMLREDLEFGYCSRIQKEQDCSICVHFMGIYKERI